VGEALNFCLLASFFVGGALLLERRCIGQMAFVQPMAIVLLAGLIVDQPIPGLWFGVTLQLLSTGQTHYCNWVLAALVAGASIIGLNTQGILILPGSIQSIVILVMGVLLGIVTDQLDKWQARKDNEALKDPALWHAGETTEPFVRLVHRRILRSFIISGLQSMVAVGATCAAAYLAHRYLHTSATMQSVMLVAIPSFGVAATLTSLVGMRFSAYAGISFVVFSGILVIL